MIVPSCRHHHICMCHLIKVPPEKKDRRQGQRQRRRQRQLYDTHSNCLPSSCAAVPFLLIFHQRLNIWVRVSILAQLRGLQACNCDGNGIDNCDNNDKFYQIRTRPKSSGPPCPSLPTPTYSRLPDQGSLPNDKIGQRFSPDDKSPHTITSSDHLQFVRLKH